MLSELLQTRRTKLLKQISQLQRQIQALPDNELLCIKNGHYTKWYQTDGSTHTYIPKQERALAEKLAVKKLITCQIKEKQMEVVLLEKYLKEYSRLEKNQAEILLKKNGYCDLLKTYLEENSKEIQNWLHMDYPRSSSHPEKLIHSTLAGHMVRSKSEALISNLLFQNKIPYLYERGLWLDDNLFFPDFTIHHPITHEIIYWEHFGMMDSATYCENTYNKLKIYGIHNMIPTVNLITTYETQGHPISSTKIQLLIQEFFL